MAEKHFRPKPGRFGVMVEGTTTGNTGTLSPTIGGTATTTYRFPTAFRKYYVERCSAQASTLIGSGGAVTGQWFIRNATGAKSVALTATQNLLTAAMTANVVLNVPVTATDAQRVVQEGDYLALDIVAAAAITQQPADFFSSVEMLAQE